MHACPDSLSKIPPLVAPPALTRFGARRYNAWNDEVRRRYGGRVQKVLVAAGFTCPLSHPRISGLAIGTRPDCLPDAVLDHLAGLARTHIIELEVGVESCDDAALQRVNRGHDFACSADAIHRAAQCGLAVTAHLILGLPGESRTSMLEGAAQLSALPVRALKLHQLQLVRGTAMARDWQRDPASVPLLEEEAYIELLADFVERLSPQILLQRLGSEVPPSLKLAPQWNMRLSALAPRLTAELARRGSWQGARFAAARA
ncbi:TIGR01212 family radical SAM protein [Thauera sp.]|jgi:radical SAM protein (TIGR01212 family)|uniref:TIGR01212 family radical SAM protein n=1 Tax=Thauera sp. TaxID=1905334 RepID=UPI002A35A689|nr:TIGR01212 family radical SAM protein [Thauera sp.]MDX9887400.1 TIGR01212 family radical SAM protein [Thauera sp.]